MFYDLGASVTLQFELPDKYQSFGLRTKQRLKSGSGLNQPGHPSSLISRSVHLKKA